MAEQNRLAALAGVASPAAAPMPSLNILSRLLLEGPRPPEASLPPTPYYTEARSARPTRPTFRDIVAQTLDPDSRGNRIAMGFTGPAQVNARNVQQGIRAFHGSPHRFDRFDMSRIGTGEGAQAYGHGLYFAENEGVARAYRDRLSDWAPGPIDPSRLATNRPQDLAQTIQQVMQEFPTASAPQIAGVVGDRYAGRFNAAEVARVIREAKEASRPVGSMYEVNLRADPSRLLDWDASLTRQPETVQSAVRQVAPNLWARVEEAHAAQREAFGPNARLMPVADTGESVWRALEQSPRMTPDRAAATLRDAGIPGIRYLDGGSRAARDGTRNYVMFDDNLIDIVRRYGLAGLLMGGGGAAAVGGASDQ